MPKKHDEKTMHTIWESKKRINAFVSYSGAHADQATALTTTLKAFGICSFMARLHIAGGDDLFKEIREKLKSMDILVALVAGNFPDKPWPNYEMGAAWSMGVPIIPVMPETPREPAMRESVPIPTLTDGIITAKAIEVNWHTLIAEMKNRNEYVEFKYFPEFFQVLRSIFQQITDDDKITETIIGAIAECPRYKCANFLVKLFQFLPKPPEEETKRRMVCAYWDNDQVRDAPVYGTWGGEKVVKVPLLKVLGQSYTKDLKYEPSYCRCSPSEDT